uniref:Col_cuticle_N domain-containing protein n=1 Tax=Panagrellus redivivus TaxID=6233 RepID=A0A7E4W9W1_PANRE
MQTHFWCFLWYFSGLCNDVIVYTDYFRNDDKVNVPAVKEGRKYVERYGVTILLCSVAFIVLLSMTVHFATFSYDENAPQICNMCAKLRTEKNFRIGNNSTKTEDARRVCIWFTKFNCVQ